MRFVDEFRDAELGRALAGEILAVVEPGRHYKLMEVCGGHTHSIYKYGIDDLLPANVELVHGPGCPVCVIPMGRVDDGIAIAHQPDVIFTCFGDMMRIPGSDGSLQDAKAAGADVRMVYSPLDAFASCSEPSEPGMRIMSPKQVKITLGWWAIAMPSSTRPIGITHTGQPGPWTSSTFAGRRSSIPYL